MDVHGVQTWGTEEGLVVLDPPTVQLVGRRGSSREYAPDREEYERLLDNAEEPMDQLILNTLGGMGLRVREFLSVRRYWFEDGKLIIPISDPDTGFRAKTRRAARTLPREMSREAWVFLRNWFREHEDIGIGHAAIWQRVRKAGLRAELRRRLFPHALRAYCATKWAYRIPNVTVLQDVFGWESPKVAQRYIARSGGQAERAFREWRLQNG